ncbi:MAG TPA: hypothetical protein VFQ05_14385 [Candidatus Eisenbacteria bacterium]|nr:hypothetical protein [Candidatus Eisenbacteria bacterium]
MTERKPHASRRASTPAAFGIPERLALAAWVALAALLHLRSLGTGFVEGDLAAISTALRTNVDALLRGGAYAGSYAPLSRELWWWWWSRVVPLDAFAFHLLHLGLAVATAWLLFRAGERWGGAGAGLIAGVLWTAFPPLGGALAQLSGARDLIAALTCAAAISAFARGRFVLAALACAAAPLAGIENALLPLVLLVADRAERPADGLGPRLRRLAPALVLGFAAAVLVARIAPSVVKADPAGARALPWLLRSWLPVGTGEGFSALTRDAPWLLVAVMLAAGIATLGRRSAAPSKSPLLQVGLAAMLLPLVPLALSPETPRAARFAVPALGLALAVAGMTRKEPWPARIVAALAAVLSLCANAALAIDRGAPKFTSASAVRASAASLQPLLDALRPWCPQLRSVPRTFAAGVPPDSAVRLALDVGARAVCHDPDVSVRFIAELTPEDAGRPFGVLRRDASGQGMRFETADAQVRARVGEGLLVFARHAPAAACFEAALAERPDDRELIYPTVAALASAQRTEEARTRWEAARRSGLAPAADTLAMRLLVGFSGVDRAGAQREVTRIIEDVVRDPTSASAHLALGKSLLKWGSARSAALELSVACGIGRRSQDVFWLARAYDAMGARFEALEAYRATLAGGLDSTEYRIARTRLPALLRELGPGALGTTSRP